MSDFERQLRDALRAAVADAQPPPSLMESVRRRHRRRNIWLAAASVVVLAAVAVAVPVASASRGGGGRPAHGRTSGAPLFPGGGRLLLDRGGVLEWLYPDGRTVQVAFGFAGAALAGGKLLAWTVNPPGALPGPNYYTVNLDGSDARLVLPAERPAGNTLIGHQDVQLSPGGSMLGYVRVEQLRNGSAGTSELWSMNLTTGRKTDLGPYSRAAFVWRDNATILADSASGRSLQLVNVRSRSWTTYLAVDDPRLIRAYERAWPGHGPPVSVGLDGWSPGASALAVSLAGRTRCFACTDRPAELLVERDRVLAFARSGGPWISLTMKWGPNGIFLLDSQSGPPSFPLGPQVMYAGTVHSERLSRLQTIQDAWNASAVNPEGTVIALAQPGFLAFVPVPPPACEAAGKCLRFPEKQVLGPVLGRGMLLAWARG